MVRENWKLSWRRPVLLKPPSWKIGTWSETSTLGHSSLPIPSLDTRYGNLSKHATKLIRLCVAHLRSNHGWNWSHSNFWKGVTFHKLGRTRSISWGRVLRMGSLLVTPCCKSCMGSLMGWRSSTASPNHCITTFWATLRASILLIEW